MWCCSRRATPCPADGRLLESASLKIEEAALTGESVPVNKFIDIIHLRDGAEVPLGDRKNMVYMGSTVVYGRGSFVVTATGMDTEMGKIADALANAAEGQTPLQIKLTQLSKILTWMVLGICAVIFAVQLLRYGRGFRHRDARPSWWRSRWRSRQFPRASPRWSPWCCPSA